MSSGPQCPKCGAFLKDDYGMVTCAKCGTISMVDMDGVARLDENDALEAVDPIPPREATYVLPPDLAPPTSDEGGFAFPPVDDSVEPSSFAPSALPDLAPEPQSEPDSVGGAEFVAETEPPPPAEELNMDQILGYQDPAESREPVELGAPGDPLGINAFANSEVSQAKDGLLVFKLRISGIDSKEIRESLREAIEDARFSWDTNAIMTRINKGHLVIENVSPVKATILINRIKRLPVKIRWEQYAITQLDEGGSV